MATMKFPVRRLIIAGGFAAAIAAAPAVAVVAMPAPAATPLAQCAGGEEEDLYTGVCVPHTVPNSRAPYQAIGATLTFRGGHARRRRGDIPCTGHNSGQCIGLAEEAQSEAPAVAPSRASAAARRSPASTTTPGRGGQQAWSAVGHIYGGVMAAKSDPAEIGDVEPLADSTASQARRVVAAYATDADECRVFLSMLGIGPAKLEA